MDEWAEAAEHSEAWAELTRHLRNGHGMNLNSPTASPKPHGPVYAYFARSVRRQWVADLFRHPL